MAGWIVIACGLIVLGYALLEMDARPWQRVRWVWIISGVLLLFSGVLVLTRDQLLRAGGV